MEFMKVTGKELKNKMEMYNMKNQGSNLRKGRLGRNCAVTLK